MIVFSLELISGEDEEEERLHLKQIHSKSFVTSIQQITCSKTDDVACIGFHNSCDFINISTLKDCKYDAITYALEEDEVICSFLPLRGKCLLLPS